MHITKTQRSGFVEVHISGRLDGYWADHLAAGLAEVVREGGHRIRLNFSEVSFLSSAGIRVLLQFFKQLRAIDGSLGICRPSDHVNEVLNLAGLRSMLIAEDLGDTLSAAPQTSSRRVDGDTADFDVFALPGDGKMTCRSIGQPSRLEGCRFEANDVRTHIHDFPNASLAIGLGAFGKDFADCQNRFGEFLWVAGAATYLPTDGTNVPDYLTSGGSALPDLKVLYGLSCEGSWRYLARFEAKRKDRAVTLSAIVETCLEIAGSDMAAITMIGESAGLVGASLKQSPVRDKSATAPFGYPEVQRWLSFTPERACHKTVVLVAGVAARAEAGAVASFLRPLGHRPVPAGHMHAAAFSYRPLRKGELNLDETVRGLFESETPQTLLHLLHDDRHLTGAGESEFVQGACWIGPIGAVQGESGR